MAKTCNNCRSAKEMMELKDMPSIPFAAHEAEVGRQERQIKRMWIVILVLIGALIGTNLAWIIYESQFETITEEYEIQQENDGGNNNSIINGGEVVNGETND